MSDLDLTTLARKAVAQTDPDGPGGHKLQALATLRGWTGLPPLALTPAVDAALAAQAAASELGYLLWANDRQMWWRPDARGYTADLDEAGRFTEAEACRWVVQSALAGRIEEATVMVVARGGEPR